MAIPMRSPALSPTWRVPKPATSPARACWPMEASRLEIENRKTRIINNQTNKDKELDMLSNNKKLIAVVGATGQQGGGVVRALQASGQFEVRALSRDPGKHRELADEVVEADLNRPETLRAAFAGAHGVFLVTNFWEPGTDELKQATTAVRAARDAGV